MAVKWVGVLRIREELAGRYALYPARFVYCFGGLLNGEARLALGRIYQGGMLYTLRNFLYSVGWLSNGEACLSLGRV